MSHANAGAAAAPHHRPAGLPARGTSRGRRTAPPDVPSPSCCPDRLPPERRPWRDTHMSTRPWHLRTRLAALRVLPLAAALAACGGGDKATAAVEEPAPVTQQRQWTVLVYMAADNNLAISGIF